MQLSVLGPLEAFTADGRPLDLALRERRILELLAAAAPRNVSATEIVEALWPDGPPRTAANQVQGCIGRIRRAVPESEGKVVLTVARGYRLADEVGLDLHRYREAVRLGREALAAQRPEEAHAQFSTAMDLWRDDPFPDAVPGNRASALAARLRSAHLDLCEEHWLLTARTDPAQAVAELQQVVELHPLRESAWAALMRAQVTAGKSSEAVDTYGRARTFLRRTLGVEPSEPLRSLHTAVLRGEEQPAHPPTRPVAAGHLPPAPVGFVGREELQQQVSAALLGPMVRRVVVVHGPAGIGKTALALKVAHEVAPHFPDGVLHVPVHGPGQTLSTEQVVEELLSQLGVPTRSGMAEHEQRRRALAEELSTRRVLVVLDDLIDADQLHRVLPVGPVTVLATTTHPVPPSPGVTCLPVPPLDPEESVQLLHAALGSERTEGHEAAAAAVARACGHSPLALNLVAGRLRTRPSWSLEVLLDRLLTPGQSLPELAEHGFDLGAGVENVVQGLGAAAREAFALLPLAGEDPFPGWVVGALTGRDDWFDQVDALVDAHLLLEEGVDALGQPRYRVPTLTRAVAQGHADALGAEAVRAAAGRLVATWWTLVEQTRRELPPALYDLDLVAPEITPPEPATALDRGTQRALGTARAWLHTERRPAAAAVQLAAEHDLPGLAAGLACSLMTFFDYEWLHEEWRATAGTALAAVEAAGAATGSTPDRPEGDPDLLGMPVDAVTRARLQRGVAQFDLYRQRYEQAEERLLEALDAFEAAGDERGIALTHLNLLTATRETHRRAEAHSHAREAGRCGVLRIRASARSVRAGLMLGDDRPEEALELYDLAVSDATRADDPHRLGLALRGRARTLARLGRMPRAVSEAERSVALFDQIEDSGCLAHALRILGELRAEAGDEAGAREAMERADGLYLTVGRPGARGPYDAAARFR